MIQLINYEIVNGTRTEKIPYERVLSNKKELEQVREYLESVTGCFEEEKTITGTTRKRVKNIMFVYKET